MVYYYFLRHENMISVINQYLKICHFFRSLFRLNKLFLSKLSLYFCEVLIDFETNIERFDTLSLIDPKFPILMVSDIVYKQN